MTDIIFLGLIAIFSAVAVMLVVILEHQNDKVRKRNAVLRRYNDKIRKEYDKLRCQSAYQKQSYEGLLEELRTKLQETIEENVRLRAKTKGGRT